MRRYLASLLVLAFAVTFAALPAHSQIAPSVTIKWTPPTQDTSGKALTGAITYNVYQYAQGTNPVKVKIGQAPPNATITTGLTAGTTQCFTVTAVVATIESDQSNEACLPVPLPTPPTPKSPTTVTVVITTTT